MSTVLMYHYIGDAPTGHAHAALWVPAEEFRDQLAQLKRMKCRVVTGPEFFRLLSSDDAKNLAWLTFDDGRADNYDVAFPMLMEAGLRATFFVNVAHCLDGEAGYMTPAQLREMHAAGMEIASHGLDHPHLARIPAEEMRRQVFESKARLEDCLGAPVVSFCYPYGNRSPAVEAAVAEAGYQLACSTVRDNRNVPANMLALSRAMVQPGRTGWRFRYLFGPIYHFVHARKNRRRWQRGGE